VCGEYVCFVRVQGKRINELRCDESSQILPSAPVPVAVCKHRLEARCAAGRAHGQSFW